MISRRTILSSALAAPAFAALGCKKGQPGFKGYAFVANEVGQAVAVVDLGVFAVVRHIKLDGQPSALVEHPQTPYVYALTPKNGGLYEISVESLSITRRLQTSPAASMRLEPGGKALWLLCGGARKLVRVPLKDFRAEAQIALAPDATDFDISHETGLAAVAYRSTGSVSVFGVDSKRAAPAKKIAPEVGLVRFRRDGKALLAANTADRKLTVLETPGTAVLTHLPLAMRPDNFCFNQDGGQLFISGEGVDAVAVVYPYWTPQVAETTLAGHAPGAMAVSDTMLFVANPQAGDVTIMDVRRRRVIAVATVGTQPGYIAVTPNNQYALVLNQLSGDMAIIRTAAVVANRQKSAALFTMIPVGSKPVSAVVKAV